MPCFSQEFSCGHGRLRVDVESAQPIDRVVQDMNFLNYRLADVTMEETATKDTPDVLWRQTVSGKTIRYEEGILTLDGAWEEGEVQKVLVSMLALQVEAAGQHPLHASAIYYQGKTVMFLGGESNSGKSMSQIEGAARGAEVVSTETVVTDDKGWAILGSKNIFLRQRAKGAERADKLSQDQGVAMFFGEAPPINIRTEPGDIDLVVMPDIDGNYDIVSAPLSRFEAEYQTYHCLMNYFGMHQLLAPGLVMPIIDTDALRQQRADFCHRFCERPYHIMRGKTPADILDEVEKLLG